MHDDAVATARRPIWPPPTRDGLVARSRRGRAHRVRYRYAHQRSADRGADAIRRLVGTARELSDLPGRFAARRQVPSGCWPTTASILKAGRAAWSLDDRHEHPHLHVAAATQIDVDEQTGVEQLAANWPRRKTRPPGGTTEVVRGALGRAPLRPIRAAHHRRGSSAERHAPADPATPKR